MNPRTTRPLRRTAALTAATLLALGVAACSDGGEDGGGDAPGSATETGETTGAAEAATDGPLSADRTEGLAEGDTIAVTLTGLDTGQGYYLGICSADGEQGGPPTCTGGREDSAWIAGDGEARATDHFDENGDAEVELAVKGTSEDGSLDCATDECVLKLFGDHEAGFGDVAELPVTFAN